MGAHYIYYISLLYGKCMTAVYINSEDSQAEGKVVNGKDNFLLFVDRIW